MFYKINKEVKNNSSHTINLYEVLYIYISCINQSNIHICFKNKHTINVDCGSTKEGLKVYGEITNKLINLNKERGK